MSSITFLVTSLWANIVVEECRDLVARVQGSQLIGRIPMPRQATKLGIAHLYHLFAPTCGQPPYINFSLVVPLPNLGQPRACQVCSPTLVSESDLRLVSLSLTSLQTRLENLHLELHLISTLSSDAYWRHICWQHIDDLRDVIQAVKRDCHKHFQHDIFCRVCRTSLKHDQYCDCPDDTRCRC